MKKHLPLFYIIAFFIINTNFAFSQTRILHYWHFNNTLPATGAGGIHLGTNKLNSNYSKPALTTGYLRFTKVPTCVNDTGYWDNLLGDTINQKIGYGSCCPSYSATTGNCAVRMRNPTDSMMFLWYIPTTNYKNIILRWESQSSSTTSGQRRMNYSYSVDSGATYITSGLPRLYDSAGTSWGRIGLNLSGINAVNNTNKLILKIQFGIPNTGTSGNNRFDNISVEADSLCSPATTSNFSTTICAGGVATITASGASTYSWSNASTSSSIAVSPTTTTNYTVTGTSSVGCVGYSVTTVLVTNSPVVTVNSSTICAGNATILSANGLSTFTWNTGSNSQTISVSPTVTTNYSVSGITAGCLINSTGSATVTVKPTPIISIFGGTSVCKGDTISLGANGALNYTWSNGTTSNYLKAVPLVNTSYSVVGVSINSCTSTASQVIVVLPLPTVNIVGSNSIICVGESATLTASGASVYFWNVTGISPSTIVVTPSISTSYSVSGSSTLGCNNSAAYTLSVTNCSGITEKYNANLLQLYPNPVSNELQVKVEYLEKESTISIYNLLGVEIYSTKISGKMMLINTQDYQRGLYTVLINTGKKQLISRFIKE